MAKFHVLPSGEPALCEVEEGPCPLGSEHFPTPDAASEAYESDLRELARNAPE